VTRMKEATTTKMTGGDGKLNEHSLEDCLGRHRATATYIVEGWDCLGFNSPPQYQYSFLP
jgi:hypothetical protein